MVVIVDFIDQNRVLVDSVDGKFPRTVYPLKRLNLTKLLVNNILRGARTGTLAKQAKEQKTGDAFKKTPAYLKMERSKKRANLTDFERFKVMVTRKQRNYEMCGLNSKKKAKGGAKGGDAKGGKQGGK